MIRAFRSVTSLAVLAGATAVLAAQRSPLNLRAGLWEMTLQLDLGASVPGVDTSKMTPEQRARMEAIMRGQGAAKPTVTQSCVTKEDLEQNRLQQDPPNSSCKTTVTRATGTVVDLTQTCTGMAEGTREAHIEAPTPTAMKMVSKSTSGRGAGTTVTITGRWLNASCGTVK